ncbi:hypothetical protein TeGR_g7377 [Tetraparma gracilis]|uniref:Uncharacterized protein n=1 Tax=Tetraparma gracilis TaxID=2962635 RepID=A0ABQ6MKN6_9STRA|nr:hypothetical protein TeGR_g7377 [Tetraparma gracilis]
MSIGSIVRVLGAALVGTAAPPLFYALVAHLDSLPDTTASISATSAFACSSVVFGKLLRGHGSKGTNYAFFAIPVLAYLFYAVVSTDPNAAVVVVSTSSIDVTVIPLPPDPTPPPASCSWFYEDSVEALSIPPNSTYPDSSLLPDSFLRSSVCLDDFTEADQGKLEGAIDAMDMIAVAAGVGDDEWQKDEYFKNGVTAATVCGFGVNLNQGIDTWELDVSGCELEELGGWKEAFADLEVLDLSDNELAELPEWLGERRMGRLRELRASNNKLGEFGTVDWRKSVGGVDSTALELVDLRDNEIEELPYEMMDVEGEGLQLMFDGNPCAEEVDWSGLGKDRLPARMGVRYDNGNFGSRLRVLKLAHNELDESVLGELVNAGFVNITDLDVSWNALGGIGEEVRGQEKLRSLDVSGNSGVGARDLVAAPPDLEMLNASFCGVDDITGEQAVELQDRNMVLHGNPVTEITWAYKGALTKIPAWLRTLEKVRKADLGYCDVKGMNGGAFPASLEELNIQNQVAGLRLHPDSFEGLSMLEWLDISTNTLAEDDMHPGLFGGAKLEWLRIYGNPDMLNFDAAALFPGSSGQQLEDLNLSNCLGRRQRFVRR